MVIYQIRNKVTGQSYIGSTRNTAAERASHHRSFAQRGLNYPLAVAIREYGWDNFEVLELSKPCTVEEMWEMEKAAILLHRALVPTGYNLSAGGAGSSYQRTPEVRAKQAEAMRGRRGYRHSDAAKAKMADARSGSKNWRARPVEYHGVVYTCIKDAALANDLSSSQMQRRLRSGAARYLTPMKANASRPGPKGFTHSAESRHRMSEQRQGARHWHARRVEVDGVEYSSILDAAKALSVTRQYIRTKINNGSARYLSDARYIT